MVTTKESSKEGENLECGQTDHLTNFALLLVGSDADDPCLSGKDNTLAWVSLGMVAGAVVVVVFSVVLLEIRMRWKNRPFAIYLESRTRDTHSIKSIENSLFVFLLCH